ncbi:MAG: NAD-dependent epimerase/dehydratase family protein [Rhodospirillaceae bacterium]|jgi:threonine 3-dehydrogenase|nr:NAD-dependent epimerase/dehydratase family protein [Rhodospirillaceae bacterium]MBT5895230.1 NAD-dependent epimerase/dehydratase family protein [Rhodospirillaceae bacterium]MBT6426984.1 NAD-dependent epimerase/dehydratase family protein [Rhodospirillaceae bacterium]MBT7760528.1 NAD-dependent epimerase/dehydratase family protein [Rhodospirillaceae bacterium]
MATLTTGGAGFVGLDVARMLLEEGETDITVFSRNPSPARLGNLADRVTAVAGDVGNFSHVLEVVKASRPEVIYHLGAMLTGPSHIDPASSIQTNAMGTFYVLEAARLFDVRQVIFSSSIGSYGYNLDGGDLTDTTLQRPVSFYGATKAFGEHLGLFFKDKYGLDFRGIRYPSVIGPGVTTPSNVQYTSWMIEESAKGNPFTVWTTPETKVPVMYITEAATATVQLARAPLQDIKMVNYLVDGLKPTPTAGDIADAVRARIPNAEIDFVPDPARPGLHGRSQSIDDSYAREEWGWRPTHDLPRMIDDFLTQLART